MVRVGSFLADQRLLRAKRAPEMPAVSVVLPTYARMGSGGLPAAISSVLGQTLCDLELIVVDDGSTDGSFEYLKEVQGRDARVVIVRHERNSGLPALRVNEGIELSRGRWVAFQFDDDLWMPEALEALHETAAGASEPVAAFGSAEVELASGERRIPMPAVAVDEESLGFQNRVYNNAVLIPRSAFEAVGLADCHVGMRRLCDWDLWLRMVRKIPFLAVNRVVARLRLRFDARALSLQVPTDLSLFRFWSSVDRREALSLERWHEYEVDAAGPVGIALPAAMARRLQEEQLSAFRSRHRDLIDADDRDRNGEGGLAPPRHVLVAGDFYRASAVNGLSRHNSVSAKRTGGYAAYFVPLSQLGEEWTKEATALLLVQSATRSGAEVLAKARESGLPVGFLLDEGLPDPPGEGRPVAIAEQAAAGVGTAMELAREADAVWVAAGQCAASLERLSRRIVPCAFAIDGESLPRRLRGRAEGGVLSVAYVPDTCEEREWSLVEALLEGLAQEWPGGVRLVVCGSDPASLAAWEPPVPVRVTVREKSHERLAAQLRRAEVDVLLAPFVNQGQVRWAIPHGPYGLAALVGALGVFSDVPAFQSIPGGLTCLRVANDAAAWTAAGRELGRMPAQRFDGLRRAMLEHVRLELTAESQVEAHEAACRALEFHGRTRDLRDSDGRPRIWLIAAGASVAAGEEEQAALLERFGVAAELGRAGVSSLRHGGPVLVHDLRQGRVRFGPGVVETTAPAEKATPVGPVRGVPSRLFETGRNRLLHLAAGGEWGAVPGGPTEVLVAAPPQSQLALALAPRLGPLLHARGWSLCIQSDLSPDRMTSVALCVAPEDQPGSVGPVSWSAAAAVPCIVYGREEAAGASERIVQEILGILDGPPPALADALRSAFCEVRGKLHPDAVANRLFAAYLDALGSPSAARTPDHRPHGESPQEASAPAPPCPGARVSPMVQQLRHVVDQIGLYRPLSRLRWSLGRRRVLVVYDNPTVSTHLYYGAVVPDLEAATSRRWVIRPSDEVQPEDLYSFHAVVFQRAVSERSLELLEAARREGCRTLYDADDNLLLIDQVIDDHEHPWRVYFGGARERIARLLAGVDGIKVYSPAAVPFFTPHNRKVTAIRPFHIVPDGDPVPAGRERPVRVGFLGSYYKDADFAPLVPLIRELLDGDYPLAFEFFGFCPEALADDPRVTRLAWEPDYARFRDRLRERRWEIGLAPLRELDFNRCKTNIKYREYAASGIAGIYSRAEIYRTSVEDRRTGLLVPQESGAAWREAILELAENPMLRRWLARNALADLRANYRREEYVAAVAALVG